MADFIEEVKDFSKKLNEVSPSFCLAKWLQVTLVLQNGHTHSCHHPDPHKIPLAELKLDPSALHNTSEKLLQRAKMLKGERPKECGYCWNIEDTHRGHVSDRHIKSANPWAKPHFDRVRSLPWDHKIKPTYLEVSYSNVCNFKCAYCVPHLSSAWMNEIEKFGPYPIDQGNNSITDPWAKEMSPIPPSLPNPYVEAFWKWWPEIYSGLEVFRVTGGEPLLTPNTFRMLDFVNENPNPKMQLAVNSNLGVPRSLVENFARKVNQILNEKKVGEFVLYTSLDTWGAQAEYIRYGMKFNAFLENIRFMLKEVPKLRLTITTTFNALSVENFSSMLLGVLDLKGEFGNTDSWPRVTLDISYLRNPIHMSANILTSDFQDKVKDSIDYMYSHKKENSPRTFSEFECGKLKRILDWMKVPLDESKLNKTRADFYKFFTEYDERRKTNFLVTFPEMKPFWELCKKNSNISRVLN